MSATRPGANGHMEVRVKCHDQIGRVEYGEIQVHDAVGQPITLKIPMAFRWVCNNRLCRHEDRSIATVHRMILYGEQEGRGVGEYVTLYVPKGNLADLVRYLEGATTDGSRNSR